MLFNFSLGIALSPLHYIAEMIPLIREILNLYAQLRFDWELSALEVGGRLYIYNSETNNEMYVEIIELVDPPHQLVTRIVPEPPSTVVKGRTYTLKEETGGARLTVALTGYEQELEDARWRTMEENAFGFGMMLQNAKAYVEGESLPFPWGF
jgi:hypothetical protein